MDTKEIVALAKLPLTDAGNGERLQRMLGACWRYVPEYQCWLQWTEKGWKVRNVAVLLWAIAEAFRELRQEFDNLPCLAYEFGDEKTVCRIRQWLLRIENINRLRSAIRIFKELVAAELVCEPVAEKSCETKGRNGK